MNKSMAEHIVKLVDEERQHPVTEERAAQIITDFLKSGPAFRQELEQQTKMRHKRRRLFFGMAFGITAVLLIVFILF